MFHSAAVNGGSDSIAGDAASVHLFPRAQGFAVHPLPRR